jgi:SEC-C motif-containing protein
MRSRFSAYALDLLDYLQSTWDASSRPKPEKLNFGGEPIEWLRLEILSVNKGGAADKKGVVEFKAYYRQNGADQLLQEASRFIKTNGRWYYLDGVVKSVGQKIQQVKEGKNAPCSCGSGKKFKRCCGTN